MSRANRFRSRDKRIDIKINKGQSLFESAQAKLIPHFFRDILLSNTRHVPARIILHLSVYLSEAFLGVKCNGDNVIRHVTDGHEHYFSNFCLGSVLG